MVDLPKDVQKAYGSDYYPTEISIRGYKPDTSVPIGQIDKALKLLNKAQRPIFLAGGGVAELTHVPVVTTIMGKGAIPTTHELYIGNIGIHGSV